jgi:hypothetical protein
MTPEQMLEERVKLLAGNTNKTDDNMFEKIQRPRGNRGMSVIKSTRQALLEKKIQRDLESGEGGSRKYDEKARQRAETFL